MNPNELAKTLNANIKAYLDEALPVRESFPDDPVQQGIIREKIDAFLEANKLVQEPFVELMPPYVQGCSLQALADEGVIHPQTAGVFAKYFGSDDPGAIRLHRHQEEALRGTIERGQNMVVCSGTGSGKTECFLIPVIDKLIRMNETGNLENEVYVMLLYPMNALVNDQLRRLRKILKHYPAIRFGKYTGELVAADKEENLNWSDDIVRDINETVCNNSSPDTETLAFDDNATINNEVSRRTEWDSNDRRGHIMVTNFSMLERLLLNPKNSHLFSNKWKYIVLDEAHTYNGSLGTDMAWLMRRLAHRLGSDDLRFLATSATLSNDADVVRTEFAAKLFPAEPETFGIYYGERQGFNRLDERGNNTPTLEEIRNAATDPLPILENETNLLKATKTLASLQDFAKQGVFEAIKNIIEAGQTTLANAIFIAQTVFSLAEGNNDFNPHQLDKNCPIIEDNVGLQALLEMMRQWYVSQPVRKNQPARNEDDAFNLTIAKDLWRTRLHDYTSPKKSSIPGDTLGAGQVINPIGNNLHILQDWQDNNFTLAAADFLLQNANEISHLLECSDQAEKWTCDTDKVTVTFTGDFRNILDEFTQWSSTFQENLNAARNSVERCWKVLFGEADEIPLPQMFARYLSATDTAKDCYESLLEETPEHNKYNNLRENLHLNDEDVDTLFTLGSMARNPGSRFPVLDVRVHQFVRGLSGVGIYNLRRADNGAFDFDLTSSPASSIMKDGTLYPVFTLGVCRDCGHPFVLAYMDNEYKLARYADDTHSEFRAFGFLSGAAAHEAFVDFATGTFYDENAPRDGKIPLFLNQATDANHPEYIGTACPVCGARPGNNNNGARYGKITPYQANSTPASQLQMVVIDTLAKNTEPANNPIARGCPGEGRKLLVFSDSRQGASKHVVRYQEYWANTSLKKLLYQCAQEFQDFFADENKTRDLYNSLTYVRKHYEDQINALALEGEGDENYSAWDSFQVDVVNRPRTPQPNNFRKRQIYHFNYLLVKHKLDALLELEGGNDYTIVCYRLLKTLLSGNRRHNPIEEGTVTVQLPTGVQNDINARGLNVDLCQSLFNILLRRAPITQGPLTVEMLNEINDKPFSKKPIAISNSNQQQVNTIDPMDERTVIFKEVRRLLGITDVQQIKNTISQIWNILINRQVITNEGYLNIWNVDKLKYDIRLPDNNVDIDTSNCIPVRIEEHTAQISKEYGKAFQQAFAMGKINILSCSTTFEMGVDLGDLNCLYMSNLPPTVASYRQRAGRAGRRAGATAYVLTMLGNSDSNDEYYFEHAERFVFGHVEPPRIYLDNPVYRARHLRAAALYKFLKYIYDDGRAGVLKEDDGTEIKRKFDLSSHFFGGRTLYHRINRDQNINRFEVTSYFPPLAQELTAWYNTERDNVNNEIRNIRNAENVDHDIAGDLVWQILGNENPPCDGDVSLLGGRRSAAEPTVMEDFMSDYAVVNFAQDEGGQSVKGMDKQDNGIWLCTPASYHLMQEETVAVLSQRRVLPKYGFPVDVIPLKPAQNDPYRNFTDRMERVKNIAIYEYAPGMKVVANKRTFTSQIPLFKQPRGANELPGAQKEWYYCSNCKNIFEEGGNCPCCQAGDLKHIIAKNPDGFLAQPSQPYGLNTVIANQKGCRVNTTFNQFNNLQKINETSLSTATSLNGSIIYLNMGPKYEGYQQRQGENYSLYHESRTDVVYWKPAQHIQGIFGQGSYSRLRKAMVSAASALVKAAALCLNIRLDEISVISFPYDRNFGFIFYDETPGGNGLITGMLDNEELIKNIIDNAIDICESCDCNSATNSEDRPVSFNEYQQQTIATGIRPYASCFKCLRTHKNQFEQEHLDRYDALRILKALKEEAPAQEEAPAP